MIVDAHVLAENRTVTDSDALARMQCAEIIEEHVIAKNHATTILNCQLKCTAHMEALAIHEITVEKQYGTTTSALAL